MDSEELKTVVLVWSRKIGRKEAFKRLVNADLSGALAGKILAGCYDANLSLDNANIIMAELRHDGFISKIQKEKAV